MAINKKGLIAMLKHPIALARVMNLCKDKTDVARYERLLEDDNFLSVEANVDAFMQVIVTDTALWGGDLWLVFLPNESEALLYASQPGIVTYGHTVSLAKHVCPLYQRGKK